MNRIRLMTPADVPFGMSLKVQAGWNQLEADWRRFLDLQPEGCFVAEYEGQAAGTLTTCIFGPIAWIAMVLVSASLRNRGIGRSLMTHALAWLEEQGVRSVRLDATPLGQPLYERLGFVADYRLARYEGTLPAVPASAGTEAVQPAHLDEIAACDWQVTRTERGRLLRRLYEEWPAAMRQVRAEGRLAGFIAARRGARAVQIGPCCASREAGPLLFAHARQAFAGEQVFIDIPIGNSAAVAEAEASELRVQRYLLRMTRGEPVHERIGALWASSGPEKG